MTVNTTLEPSIIVKWIWGETLNASWLICKSVHSMSVYVSWAYMVKTNTDWPFKAILGLILLDWQVSQPTILSLGGCHLLIPPHLHPPSTNEFFSDSSNAQTPRNTTLNTTQHHPQHFLHVFAFHLQLHHPVSNCSTLQTSAARWLPKMQLSPSILNRTGGALSLQWVWWSSSYNINNMTCNERVSAAIAHMYTCVYGERRHVGRVFLCSCHSSSRCSAAQSQRFNSFLLSFPHTRCGPEVNAATTAAL